MPHCEMEQKRTQKKQQGYFGDTYRTDINMVQLLGNQAVLQRMKYQNNREDSGGNCINNALIVQRCGAGGIFKLVKTGLKLFFKSSVTGAFIGINYVLTGLSQWSKQKIGSITVGQLGGALGLIGNFISLISFVLDSCGWLKTDDIDEEQKSKGEEKCCTYSNVLNGVKGTSAGLGVVAAASVDIATIAQGSNLLIGALGVVMEIISLLKSVVLILKTLNEGDRSGWRNVIKYIKYAMDAGASIAGVIAFSLTIADAEGAMVAFMVEAAIRILRFLLSIATTFYERCCCKKKGTGEVSLEEVTETAPPERSGGLAETGDSQPVISSETVAQAVV